MKITKTLFSFTLEIDVEELKNIATIKTCHQTHGLFDSLINFLKRNFNK